MAWTLVFLFGATKARNPKLPSFLRILAIIGGVTAALAGIVYAVLISIKSDQFVTHGDQTYEQAHHLDELGGIRGAPDPRSGGRAAGGDRVRDGLPDRQCGSAC